MVELVIVGEAGKGTRMKMKTDDEKIVFEHNISKEDKVKW